MLPTDPQNLNPLHYASPGRSLNYFQKASIFILRIGGLCLLLGVADDVFNVIYSRSRGYDVPWRELVDPTSKYLVIGVLALCLARPLGAWLGSGLGSDAR